MTDSLKSRLQDWDDNGEKELLAVSLDTQLKLQNVLLCVSDVSRLLRKQTQPDQQMLRSVLDVGFFFVLFFSLAVGWQCACQDLSCIGRQLFKQTYPPCPHAGKVLNSWRSRQTAPWTWDQSSIHTTCSVLWRPHPFDLTSQKGGKTKRKQTKNYESSALE